MSILGIFTVVAKKGDRFSLSPENVRKLVPVFMCLFYNDTFAPNVPVSYVWRVTTIYQHLKMRYISKLCRFCHHVGFDNRTGPNFAFFATHR